MAAHKRKIYSKRTPVPISSRFPNHYTCQQVAEKLGVCRRTFSKVADIIGVPCEFHSRAGVITGKAHRYPRSLVDQWLSENNGPALAREALKQVRWPKNTKPTNDLYTQLSAMDIDLCRKFLSGQFDRNDERLARLNLINKAKRSPAKTCRVHVQGDDFN